MDTPNPSVPPTIDDVREAAFRLDGIAVKTPLLESPLLNRKLGGRILVKAEMLQRTGSFKFRGAYNRLSRIGAEERAARNPGGVIAYSSGNHAQGVAAAAAMLDIPATIVMPADAPRIKIGNTRALGAEVIFYDRRTGNREALAESLACERRAALIRPYDDPYIIAGQGTAGLEIVEQARHAGATLDAVLAPCGGGGLIAGCALALKTESPAAKIYSVEPRGYDDTARSLAAGERLAVTPGVTSFCDALLSPMPGELTFAINSRLLAGGLAVSDTEVAAAMAEAFESFKVVVEPGGAVALAACLSGAFDCRGKTIAVVCSGGNVDAGTFTTALQGQPG